MATTATEKPSKTRTKREPNPYGVPTKKPSQPARTYMVAEPKKSDVAKAVKAYGFEPSVVLDPDHKRVVGGRTVCIVGPKGGTLCSGPGVKTTKVATHDPATCIWCLARVENVEVALVSQEPTPEPAAKPKAKRTRKPKAVTSKNVAEAVASAKLVPSAELIEALETEASS